MNVGDVEWNTQGITEVLLSFIGAAPNLEDFFIFDSDLDDFNHPLYSPDFIG